MVLVVVVIGLQGDLDVFLGFLHVFFLAELNDGVPLMNFGDEHLVLRQSEELVEFLFDVIAVDLLSVGAGVVQPYFFTPERDVVGLDIQYLAGSFLEAELSVDDSELLAELQLVLIVEHQQMRVEGFTLQLELDGILLRIQRFLVVVDLQAQLRGDLLNIVHFEISLQLLEFLGELSKLGLGLLSVSQTERVLDERRKGVEEICHVAVIFKAENVLAEVNLGQCAHELTLCAEHLLVLDETSEIDEEFAVLLHD